MEFVANILKMCCKRRGMRLCFCLFQMFSSDESESSLGSFTEVWGIGCIMYHLSCGRPVHHNIRHEPLESVREEVNIVLSSFAMEIRMSSIWPAFFFHVTFAFGDLQVESFVPGNHLKLVQPESVKKILANIFTVSAKGPVTILSSLSTDL